MTVAGAFGLASVALATMLPLLAVAIVSIKGVRQVHDRRHAAVVADVRRGVVTALADGDEAHGADLAGTGRRSAAVQEVALSLLPKLRGRDRESLARLLDERGVLARTRDALRARSAVRRERAADLLGAAGVRSAVTSLAWLLNDRDTGVRAAAARALGRIGAAESVPPLLAALGRGRVPANVAAMAVLRIGAAGTPALVEALGDGAPRVRVVAAELAGVMGLEEATGPLLAQVAEEGSVATAAARALGRLGSPDSVPTLLARLEREEALPAAERDDELAVALLTSLGQIGHPAARPALAASRPESPRWEIAAADALAALGLPAPAGPPPAEQLPRETVRRSRAAAGATGGEPA